MRRFHPMNCLIIHLGFVSRFPPAIVAGAIERHGATIGPVAG
jgi:hypothetical protein